MANDCDVRMQWHISESLAHIEILKERRIHIEPVDELTKRNLTHFDGRNQLHHPEFILKFNEPAQTHLTYLAIHFNEYTYWEGITNIIGLRKRSIDFRLIYRHDALEPRRNSMAVAAGEADPCRK